MIDDKFVRLSYLAVSGYKNRYLVVPRRCGRQDVVM
jgi:hypothetical protein